MDIIAARMDARAETSRWSLVCESVAVWLMAALLMHWLYGATGGVNGDELGVPEHDSGYHIRMAAMLPQWGLVDKFPWLQFAWFRDSGDAFVSHHYGFHFLLLPFVELSQRLTGDYLSGGRWAITFYFGATVMLFNLLLAAGGVRWRWLWLAMFLLLPEQFFQRQMYIRAIDPSLLLMLLMALFVVKNRPVLAGIAITAYVHVYLGGVLFVPVLVALYAASCALGPSGDRRFPSRMIAVTAGFWALGVCTYPYLAGMAEFLRLQVFGSGLNPDIEVGQEWKSYNEVWWFAKECGFILAIWMIAIIVRLRSGPPITAHETWMLLCGLAFLCLNLKARRFIEYWPALALLSAAYLMTPVERRLAAFLANHDQHVAEASNAPTTDASRNGPLLFGGALIALGAYVSVAAFLAGALGLGPNAPKSIAAFWTTNQAAVGAAALFVVVPVLLQFVRRRSPATPLVGALAAFLGSSAALAAATALGGPQLMAARKDTRCNYNLNAIREMMSYIKAHSLPGEIIFTDDWDTFPIFFYFNTQNYYVVGLDPKFTHARRPDLWERYVSITRARVPETVSVKWPTGGSAASQPGKIDVKLTDIRDEFHAQWVICDRDHRALANLLFQDKQLAELVYPTTSMRTSNNAEYRVFRILPARAGGAAPSSTSSPAQEFPEAPGTP